MSPPRLGAEAKTQREAGVASTAPSQHTSAVHPCTLANVLRQTCGHESAQEDFYRCFNLTTCLFVCEQKKQFTSFELNKN